MKACILTLTVLSITTLFSQKIDKLTVLTMTISDQDRTDRGHKAVTESLLNGLRDLGTCPYNFNPSNFADVGDAIFVLGNQNALSEALQLKAEGRIRILAGGPNLTTIPSEIESLITSPYLDAYFINSQWTFDLYSEDLPSIQRILHIWPAGIDENFWKPVANKTQSNKVIVYWKTEDSLFIENIKTLLKSKGFDPVVIRYGDYTIDLYKKLLSRAQLAIFISKSESQGLALAEAWAMNIPTLVWNPRITLHHKDKAFKTRLSSAPYLTNATGIEWQTMEELDAILNNLSNLPSFSPRQWVLDNMTNKVIAQNLITALENI